MKDRQSAFVPKAVVRGVEFSDDLRGCREITFLNDIIIGLYTEMNLDGRDHRVQVGLKLLAIRSCLDTLEVRLDRFVVSTDGELVDGS